ncbi:MAG TPA: hypothetical protein VHI31_00895 [Actinomycetota bacterium]|nr:hypothetical protein [Actinomycetota bacterium]
MKEGETKFIGSEKHVTFGGHTANGVNIPGGLRSPVVVHHESSTRHAAPVRKPAPPAVGSEKHITFGGSSGQGINIPGGLRMPTPKSVR